MAEMTVSDEILRRYAEMVHGDVISNDVRSMARELLSLREAARREEWVSVDERLPEEMENVLICGGDLHKPTVGHLKRGRREWDDDENWRPSFHDLTEWVGDEGWNTNYHPTHWKPLPLIPQPASEKAG